MHSLDCGCALGKCLNPPCFNALNSPDLFDQKALSRVPRYMTTFQRAKWKAGVEIWRGGGVRGATRPAQLQRFDGHI